MHELQVSQLFIYPVKSLRGFAVKQAELTPLGLKYDRHWMIINENQKFVTQRKHPKMVLIKTQIDDNHLYLSKDGMPDFQIALTDSAKNIERPFTATVWQDNCMVQDEGDEVSAWLMQALNSKKKLRLVRMAKNHIRPQSNADRFGSQNTTQFADAVAYLISYQASLDKLNQELKNKAIKPCSIEQFRPNIVLNTSSNKDVLAPFQEHEVKEFVHTDYSFTSHDHCQRCIVPTIDLNSAEKHPLQEPYKTLVGLNPMPDQPKAPAFGQNATLKQANKGQLIKLNDPISITML